MNNMTAPATGRNAYGVSLSWVLGPEFQGLCEDALWRTPSSKTSNLGLQGGTGSSRGSWFASCVPASLVRTKSTSTTTATPASNSTTKSPSPTAPTQAAEKKTLMDVIEKVVLPMTAKAKCSVVDLLLSKPATRQFVREKADVYISCSTSNSVQAFFEGLEETIQQHHHQIIPSTQSRQEGESSETFIFVDFLCLNQWTFGTASGTTPVAISPSQVLSFYANDIPNAIGSIGRLLLIAEWNGQSSNFVEGDYSTQKSANITFSRDVPGFKKSLLSASENNLRTEGSSHANVSNSEEKSTFFAPGTHIPKKCLWELYCASLFYQNTKEFSFQLSHRDETNRKAVFRSAYTCPDLVYADISRVTNFEKAPSRSETEENVLRRILSEHRVNLQQFHSSIFNLLLSWIAGVCFKANEKLEKIYSVPQNMPSLSNEQIASDQKMRIQLCSALGFYLEKMNLLDKAEEFYKTAALEAERKYGPKSRRTANAWHSLAHLYVKLKSREKIQEAIAVYTNLLEFFRSQGDVDRVPVMLNDIALCQKMLGEPQNAIVHFLEAVRIWDSEGVCSMEVATCLGNLANCYSACGNLGEALKYHTLSLQIVEQLHGQNGLHYAKRLVRVARVHFLLGSVNIGNEYVAKALAIYESTFGPNSQEFIQLRETIAKECQRVCEGDSSAAPAAETGVLNANDAMELG